MRERWSGGKVSKRTASRDFLPLDKNNSGPTHTPPAAQPPRQSAHDPVPAPIFSLTLSEQLPDAAAWPGVAAAIRIASLMLN